MSFVGHSFLAVPTDGFKARIREWIAALPAGCATNEVGVYAEIVGQGLERVYSGPDRTRLSPRGFRDLLVAEGMSEPRASEIKAILSHEATAKGFAAGSYTVREALKLARKKGVPGAREKGSGETAVDLAARKAIVKALEDLLDYKKEDADWKVSGRLYQVSFQRPAKSGDQFTPS